jgi:hypothetical protein
MLSIVFPLRLFQAISCVLGMMLDVPLMPKMKKEEIGPRVSRRPHVHPEQDRLEIRLK